MGSGMFLGAVCMLTCPFVPTFSRSTALREIYSLEGETEMSP